MLKLKKNWRKKKINKAIKVAFPESLKISNTKNKMKLILDFLKPKNITSEKNNDIKIISCKAILTGHIQPGYIKGLVYKLKIAINKLNLNVILIKRGKKLFLNLKLELKIK